jgi:5-methylcytosine-specific restriction endonuclease McrA
MSWTKEQQAEYMRNYRKDPAKKKRSQELQREWYHRNKETILVKQKDLYYSLKEQIIENLGGKCKYCSSYENLEFNHIDPLLKVEEASKRHMMSKDEWKKCELLCKDCHRKYTTAENKIMRKYWLENVDLETRRKLINEQLQSDSI